MRYPFLLGVFVIFAGQAYATHQVGQPKPSRIPGQGKITSLPLDGVSTLRPSQSSRPCKPTLPLDGVNTPRPSQGSRPYKPTVTDDVNKMKIRNLWWTKIQLMKHRSCQNKPGVKEENNEDDGIPEQEKRNRPSLKKWIPEKGNSINISPTKNATIPVRQTNGKPSKHTTNSGIKRRGKTSKRVKGKEKTDSKCILEKKKATNATQKARGKRMRNAKIPEDENGKGCKDKVLIFSKNRNSIKSGQRARGKANKNSAKSGNKNKERVSIKGKAQNIPDSKDVTDSGQQTSVAPRNADRKPGLRGGVRGVEQIVRITETNAGHSKKGEPYYPGQNEGNLATPGERSPRKDSA